MLKLTEHADGTFSFEVPLALYAKTGRRSKKKRLKKKAVKKLVNKLLLEYIRLYGGSDV